jgi:hypothetical protein
MKLILPFLLLCSFETYAERINGPANVRFDPGKEIVLSLNDSVEVDCTELRDNWYEILIIVKVSEIYFENQLQIKKGATLFDFNNNPIGVALEDIPSSMASSWKSGGAPGNPEVFGMNIYGFTFRDNIYESSIPENPLMTLIKNSRHNLTYSTFKKFIEDFNFQNYGLLKDFYPNLNEFMIYENGIDDPSPLDRIRFVFEDNSLIAIIHTRELKIEGIEEISIERDRKLTIFKLPKGSSRQEFIEKNNKAYWGID